MVICDRGEIPLPILCSQLFSFTGNGAGLPLYLRCGKISCWSFHGLERPAKKMSMTLDYKTLKAQHRKLRDALPGAVSIRVHRALSWVKAANESGQLDTKFIFLWIAFNAIYAREMDPAEDFSEKGLFCSFLKRLESLDADSLVFGIVWQNYSGKIRLFIDNPYVSRPFWDFHTGRISEEEWKRKFDRSCRAAKHALAVKDTVTFTSILFERLYMLRNQLIHGGATWNSKVNRAQVRDGSRILEQIVPATICIVMENPAEPWGDPCFPPIGGDQ